MSHDADAQQEAARLAALRDSHLLDTAPEAAFDDLTKLASDLLGTPVALVSLIDENRQWFKSRIGLEATETPRDVAFCAHAIRNPLEIFEVPDAHQDPRFADNPWWWPNPRSAFMRARRWSAKKAWGWARFASSISHRGPSTLGGARPCRRSPEPPVR